MLLGLTNMLVLQALLAVLAAVLSQHSISGARQMLAEGKGWSNGWKSIASKTLILLSKLAGVTTPRKKNAEKE